MARPGGPVTTRQVALRAALPRPTTPDPGRRPRLDARRGTSRHPVVRLTASAVRLAVPVGRRASAPSPGRTGIAPAPLPVRRGGRAAGVTNRDVLDPEVPPDVLIASDYPRAVGVHGAARREGTDVAVTGPDRSPPASAVDGGPTSARRPVTGFARTASVPPAGANGDRGARTPGGEDSPGSAPVRLTEQE